jgi:hypothetical protein
MKVDDNNHNYGKSTINCTLPEDILYNIKNWIQEVEREINVLVLLVFRHLKPIIFH